jgi:hypothetical protein
MSIILKIFFKPSVAGCIIYKTLPNNINQVGNSNQLERELKYVLLMGYCSPTVYYFSEESYNIGY